MENKNMAKNIYCKITGQREGDVAIKAKTISRDKKEYFITIKSLI